jgi:hypothetical protein
MTLMKRKIKMVLKSTMKNKMMIIIIMKDKIMNKNFTVHKLRSNCVQ